MKRKLSLILLLTSLCCIGCTSNKPTNLDVINEDTYITDNTSITSGDEALAKLKEGNKRFVQNKSQLINVTSERRDQLLDGQSPYAAIISCSDSRVSSNIIFNAGLGEIFDIRIAGNVVDNDTLGSLEYGVEHLNCPLLVVMGHQKCGAVTAAYDKLKNGTTVDGNMITIVDKITPYIKDSDSLDDAIEDNIEGVYEEIEKDAKIKELVSQGKLKIVKAYYSLDGTVTFE